MTTCPLCGNRFEKGARPACASCPMHGGCDTTCCPGCGYSFVTGSKTVDFLRKIFTRSG